MRIKHLSFKLLSVSLFMGMGALVVGTAYVELYEKLTGEPFSTKTK